MFYASSLWLCYMAIVLRTTSVLFSVTNHLLELAVSILIPSRGE